MPNCKIVAEMFDLMYAAKGVGLAANQVDLPYRLFVINLDCDPGATEKEFVFINPVLRSHKGIAEAEEGCLSLPGLYGDVRRPEHVVLNAYNLPGQEVTLELDGLFARAVQHEVDHLDGVLFIDRLSPTALADARWRVWTSRADLRGSTSGEKFRTTRPSKPVWRSWRNCGREKRPKITSAPQPPLPRSLCGF